MTSFRFGIFLAMLVAVPFAAAADPATEPTAVPSGSPAPSMIPANPPVDLNQASALMQTFAHVRERQQQAQTQARDDMLAALSPAHRNLVASLVGGLAVAPNPDPGSAARALDGALAPAERDGIFRAKAAADARTLALFQDMAAQINAQLTPEQRDRAQEQARRAKAQYDEMSPEQRRTLAIRVAQTLAPISSPASGSSMSAIASAQDAGSIVLRTLVAPSLGLFGIPLPALAGPSPSVVAPGAP